MPYSVCHRCIAASDKLQEQHRPGSTFPKIYEQYHSEQQSMIDMAKSIIFDLKEDSSCPSCSAMAAILKQHELNLPRSIFFKVTTIAPQTSCFISTEVEGVKLYLTPAAGSDESQYFTLLSTLVEYDFAKNCLKYCLKDHNSFRLRTTDSTNNNISLTAYLIDLVEKRLVSAPMSTEGFFNLESTHLPTTVIDAMTFAIHMGERYLWIDRYCIIQDDPAQKHGQIKAMGDIYRFSHFTIVAADGDASAGLPGITSSLRSRVANFYQCSEASLVVGLTYGTISDKTVWASRGWTFQEQLFSRRNFIFRKNSVIFVCCESVWHEGTSVPTERQPVIDGSGIQLKGLNWPDLNYVKMLLEKFLLRDLSYPCDSLNALAGIIGVVGQYFPDGFFYGLPELWFDIALLWQPVDMVEDRITLAKAETKEIAILPSWSWARWKGKIDFSMWDAWEECLLRSFYNQNLYRIRKLVTWSKLDDSLKVISPIKSNYNAYYNTLGNSIPHGWAEDQIEKYKISTSISDWFGPGQFKHASLPGNLRFRYPISLCVNKVIKHSTSSSIPTSIIGGQVQRVFLKVQPPENQNTYLNSGIWWRLMNNVPDAKGTQIGVVKPHNPSAISRNGDIYEFVAISSGEYRKSMAPGPDLGVGLTSFAGWERDMLRKKKEPSGERKFHYEFINVLMIQWKDNIAERKGLGRVEESMWRELAKTIIDINLG